MVMEVHGEYCGDEKEGEEMNIGFFKVQGNIFWHFAINGVDMTIPLVFILASIIGSVICYFVMR